MADEFAVLIKLLIGFFDDSFLNLNLVRDFIRYIILPFYIYLMAISTFVRNVKRIIIFLRLSTIVREQDEQFGATSVYEFIILLLFHQLMAAASNLSIIIAIYKNDRLFLLPYLLFKGVSNITDFYDILARSGFLQHRIPLDIFLHCIVMFSQWVFVLVTFRQMAQPTLWIEFKDI